MEQTARGESPERMNESGTSLQMDDCFAALGISARTPLQEMPFAAGDISAGSETELQAVVIGRREQVDLPLTIEQSRYFSNLQKRTRAGEAPEKVLSELQDFLAERDNLVWENSWVRFGRQQLSHYAQQVFEHDLLADKKRPRAGLRSDHGRFLAIGEDGEASLRVPVSYLVKLGLADLLGTQLEPEHPLFATGEALMAHYLSDNTSPETFSFHVETLTPERGMGRGLANETARRFLFTQLLLHYANRQFGLLKSGQQAMIYFAPHPPLRQKRLNQMISDAFYRQLFMSPCLSGWDNGEGKHSYMGLCHQVLSRSQMNAVSKLREAGIITNNLVVMPTLSNTSLANNGVHISLGSHKLTQASRSMLSSFGPQHEKYLGDLSIKLMEHFLPLFATTYSAAPYRLEFADFHPERVLGFLPHQLDYTHLRMLWRRWKKKAKLSVFGHALTPFGPQWLDQPLSRLFGLRGDLVPDFRLLDYPVCFLSSEQSPAYDGRLGNQELLKGDLAEMGIFDRQMSLYQFFKLREFGSMGFSGFEGRHYSLFPDLDKDLAGATNLQALLCALSYKYMVTGQVRHRHIPDTPVCESERRQIFFGMAIGIPTFYVLRNTRNRFLLRILRRTERIRTSRRYPGYYRVYHRDYCKALLAVLREDGADLIEMFDFEEQLRDLEQRIDQPEKYSAAGRLTREISAETRGGAMWMPAEAFNRKAEEYYRETLRIRHIEQACGFLKEDLVRLEKDASSACNAVREQLGDILQGRDAQKFLDQTMRDLRSDQLGQQSLVRLLMLMLLVEYHDQNRLKQEQR